MTKSTLLITETHINYLILFTKENMPYESCSLLLGDIVKGEYRVKDLKRMKNIANSQFAFNMDSDELKQVYELAANKRLEVIGIYHSHLKGSRPSVTDLTYMQINPVIWLIYEISKSKFKAYILDKELTEVKINISME